MSEQPADALPADMPPREEGSPVRAGSAPVPRTFGLKDVFTCINLLGGMFAIIFCIKGNVRYAAYSFLLGYILGDALDGLVARLTHTGNIFGKEFDVISDHLAQCIAPAVIVFVSYRDMPMPAAVNAMIPDASFYLAAALSSLLVIMGSIRHARGEVVPVNFPLAYMGLPRTASAFIIVSFLNSTLYFQLGGRWIGVVLLIVVSVAHILPLPFRTHRGRPMQPYVKVFVFLFFATTITTLIFFRTFVFDVTFFWLFGYAIGSWVSMYPEERAAFFRRAREWSDEVRRAR